MSDFRTQLEQWIRCGLDTQVCEAFDFCLAPPLEEKVRFIQKMSDWMVLEHMCRYGLRKAVAQYIQHIRLDEETAAWAIEVCAQHNSASIFEFLERSEFCTEEIAKNLYQNHPLMWMKCRGHFALPIQQQALAFGAKHMDHPFCVLDLETISETKLSTLLEVNNPNIAVWAAIADCPKVFTAALKLNGVNWKALGKEFLEWPGTYKNSPNNTLKRCGNLLKTYTHRTEERGNIDGLQWVWEEYFRTHGALGLRTLVNRFGPKETLQLNPFGSSLIWCIEHNADVLDGMPYRGLSA